MRVGTALGHLTLAVAVLAAACTGDNGKEGRAGTSCTVTTNADGTETLRCGADGGTATVSNGKSCTVTEVDGGSQIECEDGTMSFVASGTNGANGTNGTNGASGTPGQSCNVVSNGDGTRTITCPAGDGGTVTFNVRDALVNYASMSADDKAALDLQITVSSFTIPASGQPVVAFRVTDGSGNVVRGLPPADMRFALLKLVPTTTKVASNPSFVGVNGSANDTWVSYMAANATSTAGSETAAAVASATNGALTDNGDGTYSYTFLKKVTDPVNAGTTYDPAATHRLTMIVSESGNPFAPVNVVKDFIPATGKDVTGQAENTDGASCLECHSSFRAKAGGTGAFHGGARYDLRICVTCHNDQRRFTAIPGTGATPAVDLDVAGVVDTTGAWAGNAVKMNGEAYVNLPVFIHKIHMGEELMLNGGAYTAFATPYDVTFPQDSGNCAKCHQNVAQAANFKNKPSRRACGSCHDDISFLAIADVPAKRKAHSGGPMADDSNCVVCHPATAPKTRIGIGVVDAHITVAAPDPLATWLGGSNANTNAGYLPAAGFTPTGEVQLSYDVKSVSRDANNNPSIVFRFLNNKVTPVVFNDPTVATEIMDGFVGSPSVYFLFAVPQDGITAPADFNATANGYIKNIWNGTATGTGAGTMTFNAATGYYTITLTGVTVPDNATMLTGGVGYSYSLSSTPPLTQINLPAYPYGDASVIPGCIAGKMCGGLILPIPDVSLLAATGAPAGKTYTARRLIVENKRCTACHEQLGANPTFHAGQRNDAQTCAFCHKPNQTSSGWSASSSSFIHGIHGASERTVGYSWHAACPSGTTYPTTCTADNADPYFAKVTYPGILNNCEQCHLPGTYDFSAAASASAVSNLLMTTVAAGVIKPDISTSPYVKTDGTDYGNVFATANVTSGSVGTTACTSTAPCVCSLTAPCAAAATTLVKSPIAAACSSCHDAPTAISHMQMMGGSFYETRAVAQTKAEQCLMCHGPGTVASIALVHQ
ncbi:MAG TPA: OmcA/MtrC family decaheme c-type cytochrome [Polyangia bacterium]|jgi:decaheme c-type cytochrome, OmcA/MtrC family|nr:OmcA/MtrC family decaheme c-type cytochrome [Polyangia bacterium]